ncbi:hypothetical protein JCM18899A_21190 [Nocardioides sp. AN3]
MPVTLSRPSGRTVSVQVHTVVATADANDFTPVTTAVPFPPGTTARVVGIPVHADGLDDPVEAFELRTDTLVNATLGIGLGHILILRQSPPESREAQSVGHAERDTGG